MTVTYNPNNLKITFTNDEEFKLSFGTSELYENLGFL